MRDRARNSVSSPVLSSELRGVLQRIQELYPKGWFTARSVNIRTTVLQELVAVGYLDASRGPRSSGVNYRVKPLHLWPHAY